MVRIADVSSVAIALRLSAEEWTKYAPALLEVLFQTNGEVRPAVASTPTGPRQRGEVFMQPTDMCGLHKLCSSLIKAGFSTYAASRVEDQGVVTLRFRLCPSGEVVRDDRPLEQVHIAFVAACEMAAAWEVVGYNNPYIKGDEPPSGKRALNINARYPIWTGQPVHRLAVKNGEVIAEELAA